MKKILTFVLLALITGCMPGPSFVPYVGVQKDWKTSEGAFVRQMDGIDIYSRDSYPAKPYDVLGGVVAFSEVSLIKTAKAHNADAVLIVDAKLIETGTVSTGGDTTTEYFGNEAVSQTSPVYTRRTHRVMLSARVIRYHTP
jgi:hypothetical protein